MEFTYCWLKSSSQPKILRLESANKGKGCGGPAGTEVQRDRATELQPPSPLWHQPLLGQAEQETDKLTQ